MSPVLRVMPPAATPDEPLAREWLVTNGLGGYASGTVAGTATRRYHALLNAALPAPLGRLVMLARLNERVRLPDGRWLALDGGALVDFRLEDGLPVWRYALAGHTVERRLWMAHRQNTTYLTWWLVDGPGPLRLSLRPALNIRPLEAPVSTPLPEAHTLTITAGRYELTAPGLPPLRLHLAGARPTFTADAQRLTGVHYAREAARGYDATGDLDAPGELRVTIAASGDAEGNGQRATGNAGDKGSGEQGAGGREGQRATRDGTEAAGRRTPDAESRLPAAASLTLSTEPWEVALAQEPAAALAAEQARRRRLVAAAPAALQEGPAAELVLAADAFLFLPAARREEAARALAAGDEPCSVIAGYHWFTDWGRDTMISLAGLTLTTGRHAEAGRILRTFAGYVRDGLIPNLFPEGQREGLYHTADASLWYFHALDRYLAATGDRAMLRGLLPVLAEMIARHVAGTRFGIGVDPADGLLRQGAEGYQLTWMDAKVDGWVVTPRRGKAVEINALWYNALRLMEGWQRAEHGSAPAQPYAALAERAYTSFNDRFWHAAGGYLYDVVDGEAGDDPACRPNQLFAVALPFAVLAPERWRTVLEVVRARLLTPVGLRSLAPGHPDYQPRYDGDLRARDAAYHQGTVWSWLIGPFVDAWLRVYPEDGAGAARLLDGLLVHLGEAGIGSISEVFDAEPPYTPRGCIAQAWGVAELLRAMAAVSRMTPGAERPSRGGGSR